MFAPMGRVSINMLADMFAVSVIAIAGTVAAFSVVLVVVCLFQ
jgi:hypothetical protein